MIIKYLNARLIREDDFHVHLYDPPRRLLPKSYIIFTASLWRGYFQGLARLCGSSIVHIGIGFDGAMRSCYARRYRSLGGAIPGLFVRPLRSINWPRRLSPPW